MMKVLMKCLIQCILTQVRNRYAEQYEYEAISNLLGMEKGETITIDKDESSGVFKL